MDKESETRYEKDDMLPIPVNVPNQKDFVAGFGGKEITITVIALIISIIIAVIVMINSGNVIYAIGIIGLVLSMTISFIRRDRFNESFIDKLHFMKEYFKAQKKFEFRFKNIYEGKLNGKK